MSVETVYIEKVNIFELDFVRILMSENQIKELVSKYIETIHTQNKVDFCSLWARNAHCILISVGKEFIGVDSIFNDFLIGLIQTNYSDIKLISNEINVHLINENLATVVFTYHTECIMRKDGSNFGIKGLETQVIIKENGQWKIQHIHYSKAD